MARAPIDITNQRFGRLVAKKSTAEQHNNGIVWECECDCGNIVFVPTGYLRSGRTQSCGCKRKERVQKNIAEQRFGRLVALYPVDTRNNNVIWECKCDCGNIVNLPTAALTGGGTKSCGCLKEDVIINRILENMAKPKKGPPNDLTGQKFGKLTVIEVTDKRESNSVVWKCKCDCGNMVFATTSRLRSGNTKSCGCYRKERTTEANMVKLEGKRYGKLIAIKPTKERSFTSIVWECQCDCGNLCYVPSDYLTTGRVTSCGCSSKRR